MGTGGSAFGVRMGPDALSVHGNQYIRNFDEASVHFSHLVLTNI